MARKQTKPQENNLAVPASKGGCVAIHHHTRMAFKTGKQGAVDELWFSQTSHFIFHASLIFSKALSLHWLKCPEKFARCLCAPWRTSSTPCSQPQPCAPHEARHGWQTCGTAGTVLHSLQYLPQEVPVYGNTLEKKRTKTFEAPSWKEQRMLVLN